MKCIQSNMWLFITGSWICIFFQSLTGVLNPLLTIRWGWNGEKEPWCSLVGTQAGLLGVDLFGPEPVGGSFHSFLISFLLFYCWQSVVVLFVNEVSLFFLPNQGPFCLLLWPWFSLRLIVLFLLWFLLTFAFISVNKPFSLSLPAFVLPLLCYSTLYEPGGNWTVVRSNLNK